MRAAIGISAVIFLAGWAQAWAIDPQQSGPHPAATAPQPAQAAPTPPDLQPGVKTAPAATTSTEKKQSRLFTPGEKYLLRQGYKLEVRNGTRYFCHIEDTLGTRLRDRKV